MWLCLFTTPVFAVVEFVLRPEPGISVYDFVSLAQMVFLVALLRFLDRPLVENHQLWAALALAIELCFATAWAGILRGDFAAAPVMILLVVMASSILFPWGAWFQAGLAIGASLALTWNLGSLLGATEAFRQPMTWALEIGFGTSIMIAYWLEHSRRELRASPGATRTERGARQTRAARRRTHGVPSGDQPAPGEGNC